MENKESPYYLGNQDCPPTQLIFETPEQVFTQELPWDVSLQDLCHAFYVACSSIYDSEIVLETMYKFGSKELLKDDVYRCETFIVNAPCILITKTRNSTTKVELTDHTTGIDLCRAFYTLCLGMTYFSEHIYDAMKEYAEEMLPINKNNECNHYK